MLERSRRRGVSKTRWPSGRAMGRRTDGWRSCAVRRCVGRGSRASPRSAVLHPAGRAIAVMWIERRPIATQYPEARVRAARSHRELSPRPRRLAHPAGQQPRHRRSQAARPRPRASRDDPDAAQVERQLRGLPDRRARRAAARPAGQRARSAGARSTSCCRRRAASRSSCPISCSTSPTAASRWRRRSGRSASRSRAPAI